MEKKQAYARALVQYLRFLDPLEKVLELYQFRDARLVELASFEGDATVRAVPFDAIELDLGALWADLEGNAEPQG